VAITKERVVELLEEYQRHGKDTGSSEVQVALLTTRIQNLTAHVQTHTKDHSSRRGLMKLVGQRRRLLNYLQKTDIDVYRTLITRLELRR
jgi:small subunit ribosomal protein S15